MTEWRDARLHKALEHAPDADQRPLAAVADAIRAAAQRAVAPAAAQPAPVPWWKVFWDALGSPRSPWGAALATVLLGVLITALWVREPVPDAVPVASGPAPAPAPAPAAAPSPPPAADTQSLPAQPAARAAQAVPPPPVLASKPLLRELAATERQAAPTVPSAPSTTPADALPAAPDVARKEAPAEVSNRMAAGDVAPSAGAAAPAPAAAAALSRAPAAAPAAKSIATESGLGPWTAVDIAVDGRTATLDAEQAQPLVRRVQALEGRLQVEKTASTEVPSGAPDLQLTMRVQDRVVATLTVRGSSLRWQRERRLTLVGTLDDAQLQQLMQLAREALAGNSNTPRSTP